LSQNDLGDASVWALCDAFLNGAAPDLIELLLRDNPDIGLEGKEALRALTTARKNLAVDTGVTARAQDSSDAVPQHELGTGTGGSLRDSAIVRKYFQVDEDDDDDGGGTEETRADAIGGGEDAHMDPEEVSALLWDQVRRRLFYCIIKHTRNSLLLMRMRVYFDWLFVLGGRMQCNAMQCNAMQCNASE